MFIHHALQPACVGSSWLVIQTTSLSELVHQWVVVLADEGDGRLTVVLWVLQQSINDVIKKMGLSKGAAC